MRSYLLYCIYLDIYIATKISLHFSLFDTYLYSHITHIYQFNQRKNKYKILGGEKFHYVMDLLVICWEAKRDYKFPSSSAWFSKTLFWKISSTIIEISSLFASVPLFIVLGLEDSRIKNVDGSVAPQWSRYRLCWLDSGR